jgi:hypothetical protein
MKIFLLLAEYMPNPQEIWYIGEISKIVGVVMALFVIYLLFGRRRKVS